MAHIALSFGAESVLNNVEQILSETKHTISRLEGLSAATGLKETGELIAATKAEVVIMDYWDEDLAGIKLVQSMEDNPWRPVFIFIELGYEAKREEVLMALNEGVKAILPQKFSAVSLVHYVEKALAGSQRFRQQDFAVANSAVVKEIAHLEMQMVAYRTKSKYYQKLAAYLLSKPMADQARKVLLVSDSPYQLEILKNILEEHRFVVITATTASEGLTLAESDRPRIIISDLELEDMNGMSFCKEVKLVKKIAPCYFVICTANQDKVDLVMQPGSGTDDCIIKPSGQYNAEDFISRIALGLLL